MAESNYQIPPVLRFLMEVTSWVWMFLLDWLVAVVSILSLALLNVPGDKKPASQGVIGLAVPAKLRLVLESLTAVIGILYAFILFGGLGGILQLLIVILYLMKDKERLRWLWGSRSTPPDYVLELHKLKK